METIKTSLVLEGGGLRGAYTAGALVWLIDNDIKFDNAYGISTGAIYLATFLMNDTKKLFDISTKYINDKRCIGIRSLLRTGRIVDYDYLFNHILIDDIGFDMSLLQKVQTDAKIGLYVLEQGKTVYRSIKDSSIEILKASTTLPILGKIIEEDNLHYLDGGICDMIPINQSVLDGCNHHLVITTKPQGYIRKAAKKPVVWLMKKTYPECLNISHDYEIRHLNYEKQIRQIKELQDLEQALYIYPTKSSNVTRLKGSYKELEELYLLGYQDMENNKERIIGLFKNV